MDEHRKTRRRHSKQFKLEVLAACREPGASVAAVALAFGLNANLVRQWLRGRGCEHAADAPAASALPTEVAVKAGGPQFVALAMPPRVPPGPCAASLPANDIRIEVHRAAMRVTVSWPQAAAVDCAGWLRELLR